MIFADDVVVFCEATQENAGHIYNILDLFCKGSGKRINFNKSIFVTSGAAKRNIREILQNFRFHDNKEEDHAYLVTLSSRA